MRKHICAWIIISLMLALVGCSKSMNYVIEHEPSFVGKVETITNEYVIVNVNSDDPLYDEYATVQVSLNVELQDSFLSLSNGDEIVVYYDGNIIENKAEVIYAITLRTPATRETE